MKPMPHLCLNLTAFREISRSEAATIIRTARKLPTGRPWRVGSGFYSLGVFSIATR